MKINTGKRLTNEEALDRIFKKCKEKNVEFIGFKNKENIYKNNKTYLILKCNKCGNVWDSTCYDKFINCNRSCPNCSKTKKISEIDATKNIHHVCHELNYTFIGFVDSFKNISSKLHLKCNKCGKEWKTTSYINFIKIGRKSHACKKNNPSHMPSSVINDKIIIDRINEKLLGTTLKFVSFDENGNTGAKDCHITLKCSECGKTMKYLYRYLISKSCVPKCKNCQYNGKFSNDYAKSLMINKCKELDYTFLGFDTDDGKYNGKDTYLILRCNKCGTIWKTTKFSSLKQKVIKCPGCTNSWKMEKEIESVLKSNNIHFIQQCRNRTLPWLTNKGSLSLDFYLPDYNIAIECQGRQHFEPVDDFGGEKTFKDSVYRDEKKLKLCKENNIRLLYYDSEHNHQEFLGEKVYNTKDKILKEITSYE